MRNVLLLASLVVNVFLIGLMVGGFVFGKIGHGGMHGLDGRPGMQAHQREGGDYLLPMRHIRDLPMAERKVARALLKQRLPEARRLRREAREAQHEIGKLLRNETLDEQQLALALEQLNEKRALQQAHGSETMFLLIKNLPTEQRLEMLARMGAKRRADHKRKRAADRMPDETTEDQGKD